MLVKGVIPIKISHGDVLKNPKKTDDKKFYTAILFLFNKTI